MSPFAPAPSPSAPMARLPALGAELERLGEKLRQRIATADQPSLLLNRLQAALLRGRASQRELSQLVEGAPRIAEVLEQILREAFATDPQRLLFTPALQCGDGKPAHSLAQVAMALLRNPFLSLGWDHRLHLSLAEVSDCRGPGDPQQVLARLQQLELAPRLNGILRNYWQQPARASNRSRRERLVELHKRLFHDKAVLAYGLGELSAAALGMLMGLLDAPSASARQFAGGRWARLRVAQLAWPGVGQARLALSGSLHLWEAGPAGRGRQVVYVPGAVPELREFSSHAQMRNGLAAALNAPGHYRPWQLLALHARHQLFAQPDRPALAYRFRRSAVLVDDALADSALSRLDTQLANEWAAALLLNTRYLLPEGLADAGRLTPVQAVEAMQESRAALASLPPLDAILARLLRHDERRRLLEISFGSLGAELPVRIRQRKLRQQEHSLLKLFDEQGPGHDSLAYGELLALHGRWRERAAAVEALLEDRQGFAHAHGRQAKDVHGSDLSGQLLELRGQALLLEAQMQHPLGLLDGQELQRVRDILPGALLTQDRAASATQVAAINLGPARAPWSLAGACVITTQQALADPASGVSALLFVPGRSGGLQRFASLARLAQRLESSLRCRECEAFWPLIAADQRAAARGWVRDLAPSERIRIDFPPLAGDALRQGLEQQIAEHLRVCRLIDGGLRPFSAIADASASHQWLAHELAQNLGVPGHEARERALESIAALRVAAPQAQGLPDWLPTATLADRQEYARLLARYQESLHALEDKLARQLPDLDDFAREKLTEQLQRDGLHPALDIDTPLFDLPDRVERMWAGHPERAVGEAGPKTVVSDTRSHYSLLRLALENLDPHSLATKRRLQHGRILDPAWRHRLGPAYLIATISALDLGGQYQRLILRAFYGVDNPQRQALPAFDRALLYRLVRQRARLELFSARQQGLGNWAARAFEVALDAESAADLRTAQLDLELHWLRFAGRAFSRARHVANAVAIHDRVSGQCLVYLPGAPHAQVLTEHVDLAAAQRALVASEQVPQRRADIAQRLAAGWEHEAIEGYPAEPGGGPLDARAPTSPRAGPLSLFNPRLLGQAAKGWWSSEPGLPLADPATLEKTLRREIAENPEHWLRLDKTWRSDLTLILVHALVLRAQQRAAGVANANRQLAQLRQLREGEQRSAYWLRVLSVVPVLSIAVNAHETALALRRFQRSAELRDAVELFKAAHMTLVDAALTVYPAGLASRPVRAGHGLWSRAALKTLDQRQALAHQGALALKATAPPARPKPPLAGYALNIPTQDALALHGPGNAGSYVKKGVQFISDGSTSYEVHRPKGETSLRLKKTAAQDNELLLQIREPGEYLLRADAPEPRPGPSRAMLHRPWEPPVALASAGTGLSQWQWMTRRPPLVSLHWHAWGLALGEDKLLALSARRGLYRYLGHDQVRLVKLGERFFELLPDGPGIHPDIIFLKRPGPLAAQARSDFSRWWKHMDEQPIPLTFDPQTQAWTPRTPLFSVPAEQSLAQPLEGMTAASQRLVLERLIERCDVQSPVMTATRLVAFRRTQEAWITGRVNMPVLFSELEAGPVRKSHYVIGAPEQIKRFSRLDFHPPQPVDPKIFDVVGLKRIPELAQHTEQAVKTVLRRHGFMLSEIPKARSFKTINLICSHPDSTELYFIMLKWTKRRSVMLPSSRGAPKQMTNEWLRRIVDLRGISQHRLLQPVKQALDQGRLVKMLAGLQRVPGSDRLVVFFVRVS